MDIVTDINKQVNVCGKCSKEITSYLGATAYTIICAHCATCYTCYNGELLQKTDALTKLSGNLILPLGTTGTLQNIKYLVVGYCYKKEVGTNYFWQEYSLYNPVHGSAYLSMYKGHWTYLKETLEVPVIHGRNASFYGRNYDLFSKYYAKTVSATGEFLVAFSADDEPQVEEYISPPYILTGEKTDTHLTWFKGEYIEPAVIRSAFNTEALPEKEGVGQIQPYVGRFRAEPFKNFIIALAVLWGILQFFFIYTAKEEVVFNSSYQVTDSSNAKDIYSSAFNLANGTKNVEVKLSTTIDNNWMNTGITLVNEATGDKYDLDLEAEYYHGYEDGESWAEGANWVSKVVSSIPEGKYYLIIHPEKPSNLPVVTIDVTLKRDTFVFSNGLLLLLALLIFPVYYFLKQKRFEEKRWFNSNYRSPYEDD